MTEPVYQFVKGKGWIVQNTNVRYFTFKNKPWMITEVDVSVEGDCTWKDDVDFFEMTNKELEEYSRFYWKRDHPGMRTGPRTAGKYSKLYLFTEVK